MGIRKPKPCRRILVSAGCSVCDDAVAKIREWACDLCDVIVLDMKDDTVAKYAKELSISSVPAVAIDGAVADCCAGRGIDEGVLRLIGMVIPAKAGIQCFAALDPRFRGGDAERGAGVTEGEAGMNGRKPLTLSLSQGRGDERRGSAYFLLVTVYN